MTSLNIRKRQNSFNYRFVCDNGIVISVKKNRRYGPSREYVRFSPVKMKEIESNEIKPEIKYYDKGIIALTE